MSIQDNDKKDLLTLVRYMRYSAESELADIARDTGLSSQRVRSLSIRYGGRKFKGLKGGALRYHGRNTPTSWSSHSPGIANPRNGESTSIPAYVAVV